MDSVETEELSEDSREEGSDKGSLVVIAFFLKNHGYFSFKCFENDKPRDLADRFTREYDPALLMKKKIHKLFK
jgi:hypothetical protein